MDDLMARSALLFRQLAAEIKLVEYKQGRAHRLEEIAKDLANWTHEFETNTVMNACEHIRDDEFSATLAAEAQAQAQAQAALAASHAPPAAAAAAAAAAAGAEESKENEPQGDDLDDEYDEFGHLIVVGGVRGKGRKREEPETVQEWWERFDF